MININDSGDIIFGEIPLDDVSSDGHGHGGGEHGHEGSGGDHQSHSNAHQQHHYESELEEVAEDSDEYSSSESSSSSEVDEYENSLVDRHSRTSHKQGAGAGGGRTSLKNSRLGRSNLRNSQLGNAYNVCLTLFLTPIDEGDDQWDREVDQPPEYQRADAEQER